MQLSIIIVNWNSKDFLRRCVASIQKEGIDLEYEILVIDSGSFDGCGEMLQREFPEVRFIQNGKNLGFAKANNLAFSVSNGECILFLNPDTEVVGAAIEILYQNLNRLLDAGVVGCRLLNSDRSLQTSCIQSLPTITNQVLDSEYLRSKWPKSPLWGMAPLFRESNEPQRVEAVSGACAMMKRELFMRIGKFSEEYFMYAEDIDLAYKASQAGAINYYVPNAQIIHFGGSSAQQATSNFSVVMLREAIWRFLRKRRGSLYGVGYRLAMLGSAFIRLPLILAVGIFRREAQNGLGKWLAVLRWSINLEPSVGKYYPAAGTR